MTTFPARIQWAILIGALALLGGAYYTLQEQVNEARLEARSEAAADREQAAEDRRALRAEATADRARIAEAVRIFVEQANAAARALATHFRSRSG